MRIAARVAVLVWASSVTPFGEPAASAAADRPSPGYGTGAALAEIGGELAAATFGLAPGAAIIGLSPTPAGAGTPTLAPGIAVRLAVRVATALGPSAAAWPYAESATRARELLHGPRPLVLLTVGLEGDRLAVSAEVLGPVPAGASGGTALGRFVARRGLDAEVRSFMPKVRFVATELLPLVGSDGDVLALSCSDANRDGVPLVASLGRARLTLGALAGARYTPLKARRLVERAPVAAAPLREPIASVVLAPGGALLAGITDRAYAVRLGTDLASAEPLPRSRLPWPGGGCARIEELFVSPRVEGCAKGDPAPALPALRDALDAIAGGNVVSRAGRVRLVRAGRHATDGSVTLTDGDSEVRLEHAGAQLAVGDLDGDGAPELVTSVDTADPSADAVVAYTWTGAALTETLRIPVPSGVKALAICPARAGALSPVVVASKNGVWVLR